jgi:hypothetical protein
MVNQPEIFSVNPLETLSATHTANQSDICLTNLQDSPLRGYTADDPSIRLVE